MTDMNILVKDDSAGMPTADQAEQCLEVIARYVPDFIVNPIPDSGLPHDLDVVVPDIHKCLVAYLALMRMHEAKIKAESGHAPLQLTRCRSCQAGIVWVKTKGGKNMPVDADTWTQGDPHVFSPELGHISHFATCPNADQHRKRQ